MKLKNQIVKFSCYNIERLPNKVEVAVIVW